MKPKKKSHYKHNRSFGMSRCRGYRTDPRKS